MPRRPGSVTPRALTVADLPTVHLRRAHELATIRERLGSGTWLRVREGAFVSAATLSSGPHLRRRQLALARAVAVAARTRTTFAFSHETAALLWGLPAPGADHETHLTQRTRPGANHADDVNRHVAELPDEHLTMIAGLPATTLERTAADCAAHYPGARALVVVDAAARAGARVDTVAALAHGRRRGRGRARAVLPWVDDGAESAGESLARAALLRVGLPAPITQLEIRTEDGVVWSDLGWEPWRALVEYDGLVKYEVDGTGAL